MEYVNAIAQGFYMAATESPLMMIKTCVFALACGFGISRIIWN